MLHTRSPNIYGPGKNVPFRVATQDVARVRWSQLGSMPAVPNPTLGRNTFTAMTYLLGQVPGPEQFDSLDGLGFTVSKYFDRAAAELSRGHID